jgi:tetratricopeptide (TPR) repeat protein
MDTSQLLRRGIAIVLTCAVAGSVAAQPQPTSEPPWQGKNLKVLPKDISHDDLINIMKGYTRALGVRCTYCHVGEEGKPFRAEDFPKDEKPPKEKARVMMRMVKEVNDNYLATLAHRADPPINVQCATCHRGVAQPRMLEDVLKQTYDRGGLDSTVARYRALHDRYYGRASYDFGEVPLTTVAAQVRGSGHAADATQLLALNVEMNPKSNFAKRQHAIASILTAFEQSGADSGAAAYRAFKDRYGPAVGEDALEEVGFRLMDENKVPLGLAAFQLNTTAYPSSSHAFGDLGEAYEHQGDRKQALAAYQKAVALDPSNLEAKQKADELAKSSKSKGKSKKPNK